jgi:hypothetical protein
MIVAHVGGLPLEETLAAGGPALLTALGAAVAQLRARLRRKRSTAGLGTREAKNGSFARCAPMGRRLRSETANNSRSQEEPCSS